MICQYCKNEAEWVENKEIYGKNYGKSYKIWLCRGCDAYVGCHNNSKESLGQLANRTLREYRKEAKTLFIDFFMNGNWNNNHGKKKGYAWLKRAFQRPFHFGESNVNDCKFIISNMRYKKQLYEKNPKEYIKRSRRPKDRSVYL